MSTFSNRIRRLGNRFGIRDVGDLVDITGKETYYDYVTLLGKDYESDGNAREYYWDGSSMDTTDWDSIVRPNTIASDMLPGRWIIIKRRNTNIYIQEDAVLSVADTELIVTSNLGTRDVMVQVWILNQTDAIFTAADVLLPIGASSYITDLQIGIESPTLIRVSLIAPSVANYRTVVSAASSVGGAP